MSWFVTKEELKGRQQGAEEDALHKACAWFVDALNGKLLESEQSRGGAYVFYLPVPKEHMAACGSPDFVKKVTHKLKEAEWERVLVQVGATHSGRTTRQRIKVTLRS